MLFCREKALKKKTGKGGGGRGMEGGNTIGSFKRYSPQKDVYIVVKLLRDINFGEMKISRQNVNN